MDIAALTAFLAPVLPWLLKVGGRAADLAADKASAEAIGFAERLWGKLRGKVEAKEAAKEAAEDVAHNPNDEEFRTVLMVQLKKLLADDPELAAEVARLWQEAQAAGAPSIITTVTASGAGAVAIGRDARGTTITTGSPQVARPESPR
jgi:hypothetical protein